MLRGSNRFPVPLVRLICGVLGVINWGFGMLLLLSSYPDDSDFRYVVVWYLIISGFTLSRIWTYGIELDSKTVVQEVEETKQT
jgi:hypothetical protein